MTGAGCGDDVNEAKVKIDAGGARCVVTPDCPTETPTVQCNAGVCEDPAWGCVGEADERPASMSTTATFSVKLIDVANEGPLTVPVSVRACSLPTASNTECVAIPGATAVHNAPDGMITVTGLPADRPFRLAIDPEGGGYAPIDFYSQRPPRDTEREPYPLTSFPTALIPILANSFVPPIPVNPEASFVLASFYDCQATPTLAAGVQVSLDRDQAAPDTRAIYLASDRVPNPAQTSTAATSGSAMIINVPSGKPFTINPKVGNAQLPTMQVIPIRDRLTVALVYPRTYAK